MGYHTRKPYLSKTDGQIERNHCWQLYHQMLKNIPTTHVVGIINWENKSVTGQTYNINSILIQCINNSETRNSSIQLKPDYEFNRKQHWSYKSKSIELLHFTGKKKCNPTLKAFDSSKKRDNSEFMKSTSKNHLWARCRTKSEIIEAVVPWWSSFHKQIYVTSVKKARVGYLPAIRDSQSSMFFSVLCKGQLNVWTV